MRPLHGVLADSGCLPAWLRAYNHWKQAIVRQLSRQGNSTETEAGCEPQKAISKALFVDCWDVLCVYLLMYDIILTLCSIGCTKKVLYVYTSTCMDLSLYTQIH